MLNFWVKQFSCVITRAACRSILAGATSSVESVNASSCDALTFVQREEQLAANSIAACKFLNHYQVEEFNSCEGQLSWGIFSKDIVIALELWLIWLWDRQHHYLHCTVKKTKGRRAKSKYMESTDIRSDGAFSTNFSPAMVIKSRFISPYFPLTSLLPLLLRLSYSLRPQCPLPLTPFSPIRAS